MRHLVAYYESLDLAAAMQNIAAVQDPVLFTQGDDVRVPVALPNIAWEAALSLCTTFNRAQVRSPSLRQLANRDIIPLIEDDVFGARPAIQFHGDSPYPMAPDEPVNMAMQATGGAAADNYGLIEFCDGPFLKADGDIFTVYATAAMAALVDGVWTNAALVLATVLPVGEYDIVGMVAYSANLVAARLVFNQQQARPGVPATNLKTDVPDDRFRFGRAGVYGRFSHNTPPTVDLLGVTDTSAGIFLDLIKVG
jgi:hypothetical protein